MRIKEAEEKSLRELVRHSINMMEEHKKESTLFRDSTTTKLNELSTSVSVIKTHAGYAKDSIDSHEKDIKSLKASQNWLKGIIATLSAIGFGAIYNLFKTH